RRIASCDVSYARMRSFPSIVTPGKPYAFARSETFSSGTPRRFGTDSAQRLSCTTKTQFSLWIPAKFRASCQTPFEVAPSPTKARSEEHTSELQSRSDLVC